jgi:hypothetical protein
MAPSVDYFDMPADGTRSLLPEVGELRFLADKTVPALLAPLSILARYAASPNRRHLSAVRTIYQYLATNPHNGVTFSQCPSDEIRLWGMADASHISHGDSKSQLGFALFLNLSSGTVCARSARDTTVSLCRRVEQKPESRPLCFVPAVAFAPKARAVLGRAPAAVISA